MNKIIELSDAVSVFNNGNQTLTLETKRKGAIQDSGIELLFFDLSHEKLLLSCKADDTKTHLLLEREPRLPFGESRSAIKDSGLDFLFENCEGADFLWCFEDAIDDDDNDVSYELKNVFFDSYKETPLRDFFFRENLFARLLLYFPTRGTAENVDGIAALEIGNELTTNSGLIYYYSFRTIDPNFVNSL